MNRVGVSSAGTSPAPDGSEVATRRLCNSQGWSAPPKPKGGTMKAIMTIRLEIKPDIEANLAAQARVRGIALDAYLQSVIEDLARGAARPAANLHELRAMLDALAELGRNLPRLPPDALSRESIYQDRG